MIALYEQPTPIGSVLLSAAVDTKTMSTFLRTLQYEIEQHARRILDGTSELSPGDNHGCSNSSADVVEPAIVASLHAPARDALMREAEFIVTHGFHPEMICADKDLAQFKALRDGTFVYVYVKIVS